MGAVGPASCDALATARPVPQATLKDQADKASATSHGAPPSRLAGWPCRHHSSRRLCRERSPHGQSRTRQLTPCGGQDHEEPRKVRGKLGQHAQPSSRLQLPFVLAGWRLLAGRAPAAAAEAAQQLSPEAAPGLAGVRRGRAKQKDTIPIRLVGPTHVELQHAANHRLIDLQPAEGREGESREGAGRWRHAGGTYSQACRAGSRPWLQAGGRPWPARAGRRAARGLT